MIRFTWLQFRTQAAVALGALVDHRRRPGGDRVPHWPTLTTPPSPLPAAHNDCSAVLQAFPPTRPHAAGPDSVSSSSPSPASSASSGARRWSPASSRPAPSAWPGPRASPGPAGWRPSSASSALFSMAVAGLLSLMVTWWSSPIDQAYHGPVRPRRVPPGGIVAGRVRRVRLRPRGHRRAAHPPHPARHGGHPGRSSPPSSSPCPSGCDPTSSRRSRPPRRSISASVVEWGTQCEPATTAALFVATQPSLPGAWVLSNQIITPAGPPRLHRAGHPGLRGRTTTMQSCRATSTACTSGRN